MLEDHGAGTDLDDLKRATMQPSRVEWATGPLLEIGDCEATAVADRRREASLRTNPKGCQRVAGGRSNAETSGLWGNEYAPQLGCLLLCQPFAEVSAPLRPPATFWHRFAVLGTDRKMSKLQTAVADRRYRSAAVAPVYDSRVGGLPARPDRRHSQD